MCARFFVFPEIINTFAVTNQIVLPVEGVWFLLRRVERLGSMKPWQPVRRKGGSLKAEKGAKT